MSFFKKVVNGLFNGSKEKKEENSLKEAPLAYWEEFSHMLALVPENYTITEDIFENIKAIDGIEIKEKSLPSEDYPGQIVLSYKGTDFDVRFYLGDFYAEEMYQWQLQYFTEEEKEHILNAKNALIVYMKFEGDAKICYHLQLKLVYAMVPEMVALCDESAERMLNKKWVELAVKSNVLPAPVFGILGFGVLTFVTTNPSFAFPVITLLYPFPTAFSLTVYTIFFPSLYSSRSVKLPVQLFSFVNTTFFHFLFLLLSSRLLRPYKTISASKPFFVPIYKISPWGSLFFISSIMASAG